MSNRSKFLLLLVQRIDSDIEYAKRECDRFAAKFAANPAYAMEWSHDVYSHAARLDVAAQLRNMFDTCAEKELDTETTLDQIEGCVTSEMLRRARYVPSSTSMPSNLMEHHKLAEFARWAELFAEWK